MQRRGSITAGMRQAGEDFRARFATAQLDPLRALDLSQLRFGDRACAGTTKGPDCVSRRARTRCGARSKRSAASPRRPDRAFGMSLGWECSLKEWAVEQGWNGRRVSQEAASGILVAALGALEAHFGNRLDDCVNRNYC